MADFAGPSHVSNNKKHQGLSLTDVLNRMGNIRRVVRRIPRTQFRDVLARSHPHAAALDRQELASTPKMGLTSQRSTRCQLDFVELDVLLQVQRRKRADPAVGVTLVVMRWIVG